MKMQPIKKEQLELLRRELMCLQTGNIPGDGQQATIPLGMLLNNLPGRHFPTGAIHEFLSPTLAAAAATGGFIAAITRFLMQAEKPCLWVSTRRTIFPPALKAFGIDPDRIFFIDTPREKEALWTIEEALKCKAVSVVIGEVKALDFTQSRRLQLAVENSRATGFINRLYPPNIRPTACVARWQILPIPSQTRDGLPGVGFPRWKVALLKIRNGKPGCWHLEWLGDSFRILPQPDQEMATPAVKRATA